MKPVVMPCFCLISGHLSPRTLDARRCRGLVQLLTTYVVFQGLYFVHKMLSFRLNGFAFRSLPVEVFNPPEQVVTWFLLALLLWRAALPTVLATRAPVAFAFAVGLGGTLVDLRVNYQNIVAFFPYFVLGARLPRDVWARLRAPAVRGTYRLR